MNDLLILNFDSFDESDFADPDAASGTTQK